MIKLLTKILLTDVALFFVLIIWQEGSNRAVPFPQWVLQAVMILIPVIFIIMLWSGKKGE